MKKINLILRGECGKVYYGVSLLTGHEQALSNLQLSNEDNSFTK